jgi:pimeloyl-ACP methyl ester carboxylesterase
MRGETPNPVLRAYGNRERITPDSIELRTRLMHTHGMHDALVAMTRSKREADVPRELRRVNVPTLIVMGKRDRLVPPRHGERHARELPNARLEWIETAGHLPHEEEPTAVNALVKQFLDEGTTAAAKQ